MLFIKHRDILRKYDNYKTFDVKLGKTHIPEQTFIKTFLKNLLALPPILEIVCLLEQLIWRLYKGTWLLNKAIRTKELIEYRYYKKAAKLFWNDL
jgi:hypothetical protein